MRAPRLRRSLPTTLAVLQLGSACAPVISTTVPMKRPRSALVVEASETADCLRSSSAARLADATTSAGPVDDPELLAFLERVPNEVRRTARAAGLESVLARLLLEQSRDTDGKPELDVVALRLQVVMRISSLEIQLSSLTFEVGCMGRQMDAMLLELDRLEQRQQLVLTIASLVVGAATGVGAGVWELSEPDSMPGPLILGVVGGSASAGLGIAGFVPRRGRVIYTHERNPLAPIVLGKDPDDIYPEFVFRLLSEAGPSGEPSSREKLIEDWRRILDDDVHARDRAQAEAVLYGDGGTYDRSLVDAREKMLDALESELDGIERDLELLYRYLAVVLEDPAPAPEPAP